MEYETSPMKWCETIYQYSPYIAEFWNSITALSFIFISIFGYYKNSEKTTLLKKSKTDYTLIWFFLGLISPTSLLFHITLNYYAQFVDELSILLFAWYLFKLIYNLPISRYLLYTTTSCLISLLLPSLSPFILIALISLLTLKQNKIFNKTKNSKKIWNISYNLGIFSIFLWLLDFICIINTHSYWHIFIALTGYYFTILLLLISKYKNKKIKLSKYYMIHYLEEI